MTAATADVTRTAVAFGNDRFNRTVRRPYFINDDCFGDDVTAWLMDGLGVGGRPGQEDFGWHFRLDIGGAAHDVFVGPYDVDGWLAFIEPRFNLLARIFRGRRRGVRPEAAVALHGILSSDPRCRDVRWFNQRAFDRGDESDPRPSP